MINDFSVLTAASPSVPVLHSYLPTFFSIAATDSGSLKPGRHLYDIVITNGAGEKTRVIEGSVLVREGVTR